MITDKQLEEGIRGIIELNIAADWEWYHNAIISFCELSGRRVSDDVDTDSLNVRCVIDEQIRNFVLNYLT